VHRYISPEYPAIVWIQQRLEEMSAQSEPEGPPPGTSVGIIMDVCFGMGVCFGTCYAGADYGPISLLVGVVLGILAMVVCGLIGAGVDGIMARHYRHVLEAHRARGDIVEVSDQMLSLWHDELQVAGLTSDDPLADPAQHLGLFYQLKLHDALLNQADSPSPEVLDAVRSEIVTWMKPVIFNIKAQREIRTLGADLATQTQLEA
jgi:hypothetical protein